MVKIIKINNNKLEFDNKVIRNSTYCKNT